MCNFVALSSVEICLHPLGSVIKNKIQRALPRNKFKQWHKAGKRWLRWAEQRQFSLWEAPVTTAGSSITGTHCPPGTQANVSPLDYSNICLMDVFWVKQATCNPSQEPKLLCVALRRWGLCSWRSVILLSHLLSRAQILNATAPPSPFILPSFPILQLCVCVCTRTHPCSHVLVTGLYREADCHPGAMPGFLQSTLLPSFGLMNG